MELARPESTERIKMPSRLEEMRQEQERFWDFILGNVKNMAEGKFKWYNYIFLTINILFFLGIIPLYVLGYYYYSFVCYMCTMVNFAHIIWNLGRVKAYEEEKEIMKEAKEVKNKWGW